MKYLLDTCVICEIRKPSPSQNVLAWFSSVLETQLYLPSMVLGEIEKGINLLPNGKLRTDLTAWFDVCRERYAARTVALDDEVACEWGRVMARMQKNGIVRPVVDSQIAAMAISHKMTLVTRNVKDMEPTGVQCLNPFDFCCA